MESNKFTKYANSANARLNVKSSHGATNGTSVPAEASQKGGRNQRRKEWWSKKNKVKPAETTVERPDAKVKNSSQSGGHSRSLTKNIVPDRSHKDSKSVVEPKHPKPSFEEGNDETDTESQRLKLRKRDMIAKPDNLKYEPEYHRGFHSKLVLSLPTVQHQQKTADSRLNNNSRKSKKRKPPVPPTDSETSSPKKVKGEELQQEVFDSYKFSLNLINGEVDIPKAAAGKDSQNKYVLFIGNLPYDVTKEQLEEHFRKTGGIKSIRIPKEKGTDKGRGFAYMEFDSRISHGIALRLHQTTLGGRKINVEFTSIGGGKSELRKEKLQAKNKNRRRMKMS